MVITDVGILRDWSLVTGRRGDGGATKSGGGGVRGHVMSYPCEKGGGADF